MGIGVERPGGAVTQILSGGVIGVDDGDTFTLKTWEGNFDYNTVVADITGDGDDFPCFDHNGYLYGTFVLRGAMVSGQAVGLAGLSAEANPNEAAVVKINFGANEAHIITALVERVRFLQRWRSPFVGVEITGRMHNTDPASIEDDADS